MAFTWAIRLVVLVVLVAVCDHFNLPGLTIGAAAVAGAFLIGWRPKPKAPLSTWKSDDERFTVDFKAMIATIGGFGLGSDLTREALAKRWEEEDAEYELRHEQHGLIDLHGWTKEDWMDQSTREFQIRRKDDAIWEMRLTYKYLCKREDELTAVLKAPWHVGQMYAEEEYEKMLGFTWKQMLNRDAEPLPPGDHRPWQRVGDWVEASIETAYQRYVHQG